MPSSPTPSRATSDNLWRPLRELGDLVQRLGRNVSPQHISARLVESLSKHLGEARFFVVPTGPDGNDGGPVEQPETGSSLSS